MRRAVASRWSAPQELLDSLAHDPYREVRCAVASRPASPQALRALAADPYRQVRREVAANPSAPPEVLAQLASDDTEGAPVSDDPHLAGSRRWQASLSDFSEQAKESVRQRVARNPNTPAEVLAGMLGDRDPRVRSSASAQLVWRKLMTALEQAAPPGLVLVRRPLVRRDEWGVFVPDAAVVEQSEVPASRADRLDPATVRLAVTIAWPWSPATPMTQPTTPDVTAGVHHLWRVEVEDGPVISVLRLAGNAYLQVASARPGQPLALDEPFPTCLDPASLQPPAPGYDA